MMPETLSNVLRKFKDLIEAIEDLEISHKNVVSRARAKLRLSDGSMLWLREVWVKDGMVAYSYYWLNPDEKLIIGWDNAPHHKKLETFPHHRHIGNKIEDSQARNLTDMFNFIKDFFV